MKLWLFGTYAWQGNVKALFMYMYHNMNEDYEVFWVADNNKQAMEIKQLGYPVIVLGSGIADEMFQRADVYVNENFREDYPDSLDKQTIILNLWHGVGLKHVEFGLGPTSAVGNSIVKKNVKNYELYRNQVQFLTTSKAMEKHFLEDMPLDESQIIRGGYPRNLVYKDSNLSSFYHDVINGKILSNYDRIILFSPTYRFKDVNGSFKMLLPNLKLLEEKLEETNQLFIIKLHPFMMNDPEYIAAKVRANEYPNILFWDPIHDIYEIFDKIEIAVLDYSSIFYDLLEAGVEKFIRYIPDYDEYVEDSEFIADYYTYTDGEISNSFENLLSKITKEVKTTQKHKELLEYFFEYDEGWTIEKLVADVEKKETRSLELPELHTFDVFDTLIRRRNVEPVSVFYKIRDLIKESPFAKEMDYYLVENYPLVRQQVESDLRDSFRKTTFERGTEKLEVTLTQILERLQNNFNLSNECFRFLYETEVKYEIDSVEPIQSRISQLIDLVDQGHTVYLLSDMYLEENVVKEMLRKADHRLAEIPLYLSSKIGYQKTTSDLYTHVFFDRTYKFKSWTHYGDNNNADGVVPRKFGIRTFNHDMDSFTNFEKNFINKSIDQFKTEGYKVATMLQRYRWKMLNEKDMSFNEKQYFAYGYIGTVLVPYVDWALRDARSRGYKTLYFISRDGYYLKQIADELIANNNWDIKTKYIYGSRKLWRVPSFIKYVDEESFSPFGLFSNMDSFEDLVKLSQLSEEELLDILPELVVYKESPSLKGAAAVNIRQLFKNSERYKKRLLEIASERRKIVTQYLKQEINFEEKFAFVEFWGRGYTQDTHTRLMHYAADKVVDNPYYYIRNFTPDYGSSIRHRFTTKNANYSYFETIFATTPYKSISEYMYQDKDIVPVIENVSNSFHDTITAGIRDFSRDYACQDFHNFEAVNRQIVEISTDYQFNNPTDKYIADVFSNYEDNVGMYGKPTPFAPEFTASNLTEAKKKGSPKNVERYLRTFSRNLRMSAAKSNPVIRNSISKLMGVNFREKTKEMPINPLSNYIRLNEFPSEVLILKEQTTYHNIDWAPHTKTQTILPAFSTIEVLGLDWTKTGVPRLRTKYGYITASKDWVKPLTKQYEDFHLVFVKKDQPLMDTPILSKKRQIKRKLKGGKIYISHIIKNPRNSEIILYIDGAYALFNKNFMIPITSDKIEISQYIGNKIMFLENVSSYKYNSTMNYLEVDSDIRKGDILDITGIDFSDNQYYLISNTKYILFNEQLNLRIVTNNIAEYYTSFIYGDRILTKSEVKVYKEPSSEGIFGYTDTLQPDTTKEIMDMVWDNEGRVWFKISSGFILAKKTYFSIISEEVFEISDGLEPEILDFMTTIYTNNQEIGYE
ncbi:CDP-glycerol glycerophosphotransferase family protein [Lactococcus garvieae]|uniref:CDP-glycerol glycerophosphotransferase family protein n=1 Tax=Lactococcus garvieae TaxID=1363 RepID=UPI0002F0A4CC|nr:CDP-glycerol glycerophosphotransferase family protein [Lactococcus garvieae]